MKPNSESLEQMASLRKIRIHEPFAEFLQAQALLHTFDISLLDCYRMAGHACHAITGAFLVVEAAVERLFPEAKVCERGDLSVEFGSVLGERATGPRSNVISYITGAWAESGFPGLKGNFKRKDLLSYGVEGVDGRAVRFRRISTGAAAIVEYDPTELIQKAESRLSFPESWRYEIQTILNNSAETLRITEPVL